MSKKRPDRGRAIALRELLLTQATAARCFERQRTADGLLTDVRHRLAPGARAHCIQAQLRDGVLILAVDSAAWATRLRYQAPELQQGLASRGVTSVQVRARPRERAAARQDNRIRHRLSPRVVNHLLEAAEHLSDAGLAAAFRRLAERHRPE